MSTYEVISSACELPACDEQKRAIICGKPATTTRTTFDVTFSACEACAAALDARQGPPKEPPAPLPAHMRTATDRARSEACQGKPPGTMRQRLVAIIEASPGEVFTPARLASLVGSTNRDSVGNTLLSLAGKGLIVKVGVARYRARQIPPVTPEEEGGAS